LAAPTSPQLRLAVIGAGVMGRRHLNAVSTRSDTALTAIIDPNDDAARTTAAMAGCAVAKSPEELVGKVDAVIVAAPTAAHAHIALPLLRAGIACLVEKPLAGSEAECRALIEAARGTVLQVGHVERFNPAVETLTRAVEAAHIRALVARRMSAASARVTDIGVVDDLMVHDIDIALALKRTPVTAVSAAGNDDHAAALVTFADGCVANFIASRLTATRVRDLDVVATDAFFHLDYIERTLTRSQRRGADQAQTSEIAVPSGDALGAQLADFLESIRAQRPPRVSGADALAVMQIAWRIRAALANSV
jgi:predicted dehydrogenase